MDVTVLPCRHQVRYSSKRIESSALVLGNVSLAIPDGPEHMLCCLAVYGTPRPRLVSSLSSKSVSVTR